MVDRCSARVTGGVMRSLAYIVLSLLGINAAGAGELGSAPLRGSRAYEAAPSYQVFPPAPTAYEVAPPVAAIVQPVAVSPYSFEIGARYWYSTGKLAKDLFDDPRSSDLLNSRLTYDGLIANSFEAFGRVNLPSGLFIKGYAGVSGLSSGKLNDEDFPFPGFPYSSTLSDQRGGKLNYAMADLGYSYAANPRANVLLFGGFGYIGEKVNAYGCTQIAGNPFVCVPAIGSDVLAITEDAHWGLVRLGVGVDFKIMDRLTLSAEAAWVPYAQINSRDTHWLRTGTTIGSFSGPIPQNASGSGIQLEALLNYQIWDCFNIGVGGRYWRLDAQSGTADLEQTIIGFPSPTSQPMHFISERYGMFVQGSYKFGAM
jgi:opacity protein-like surface antigen